MGTGEQNILRWDEFHASIATNLQELRDDDEFVDVTLVCDENAPVMAHKLILSACSNYFRNMLRKAGPGTAHPILVMPDTVRSQDLAAIIDFMYHGQVAIPSDDLMSFLGLAEMFKVKGLCQDKNRNSADRFRGRGGPRQMGGPHHAKMQMASRPMQMPAEIQGRNIPGVSIVKSSSGMSGGPGSAKRPRMDHGAGPHHVQQHHPAAGRMHHQVLGDDGDVLEIRGDDEDDEGDYDYQSYGDEFEEEDQEEWQDDSGEADVAPAGMQQGGPHHQQPGGGPARSGPQLMGLVCPHCRQMFQGVAVLKEHMAICTASPQASTPVSGPPPPQQQQHHHQQQGGMMGGAAGPQIVTQQSHQEDIQECHVCDKSFKSHRTLDNHMKKQHGISAPKPTPTSTGTRGPRGRPPKKLSAPVPPGIMDENSEQEWQHHPGGANQNFEMMGGSSHPSHLKDVNTVRPVGQVAPAQRPANAKNQPGGAASTSVDPSDQVQQPGGGSVVGSRPPSQGSSSSRDGTAGGMMMVDNPAARRNLSASPRGRGRGGHHTMMMGGRGGHHAGNRSQAKMGVPQHGMAQQYHQSGGDGGGQAMAGPSTSMAGPSSSSGNRMRSDSGGRPDLQKLGLKFGGQISITSTGNPGKSGGGSGSNASARAGGSSSGGSVASGSGGMVPSGSGEGGGQQGVSITKLKGDMPVGSPVSIRDATGKQQRSRGSVEASGSEQNLMKEGQVKEEPKEFEGEEMEDDGGEEDSRDRDQQDEEYEEYQDGDYDNDGVYQGDGDFEGMSGDMEEGTEYVDPRRGGFQGAYADAYPEIGEDYEEEA